MWAKKFLKKWIAVREALLEEKKNWIFVERFNAICVEKQITDKEERISLLNIFRQLGYLLHYKDTALKGMVILNREWVTDALYRVLDDQIVETNKGWFTKADAEKIWHEEKYENRTEELLVLMQEFKLCYQNTSTGKYIVPSKLPSSIDNLPPWDENNNVRLRLQYDWMPKALAIQLLVSLHEYISSFADGKQWIWRKGAVLDGKQLELEGVQVRIRDEYEDKRISIDARGLHSETLFRIIMKKWKEVNKPFQDKVKVTSIILCPCSTCADLDTSHPFRYQSVLRAKEQKQSLQCNESFTTFSAEDILKGVYDETTVLVDSLKANEKKHSSVLDLIKADELGKAIDTITSPDYNVLFARRLEQWNRNNHSGSLSFEQKTQTRNALAQDLVNYFTSGRLQEGHKAERLGKMFPNDMEGFPSESNRKNKDVHEVGSIKEEKLPPVQVIINNTLTQESSSTSNPTESTTTTKMGGETVVGKPFYQQWWFGRIIGAILLGLVVGYFASTYLNLHFWDTWLGVSSLATAFLLMRNPKRVFLRWARFCVMAIASINILTQIDVAFRITDSTVENRPWDFFFKLGFGEEPIITVIFGVLALVLFVLHYRVMRKSL